MKNPFTPRPDLLPEEHATRGPGYKFFKVHRGVATEFFSMRQSIEEELDGCGFIEIEDQPGIDWLTCYGQEDSETYCIVADLLSGIRVMLLFESGRDMANWIGRWSSLRASLDTLLCPEGRPRSEDERTFKLSKQQRRAEKNALAPAWPIEQYKGETRSAPNEHGMKWTGSWDGPAKTSL